MPSTKPAKSIDLHLHTYHSDGTFSPEEVIRRAKRLGLVAISVTDHDTISGLRAARKAADGDLEIVTGVELTVRFKDRELHVLGYGFRDDDSNFNSLLQEKQAERKGRIQAMIERLNAHGVAVTLEEVRTVLGSGESVGRPHLAQVLVDRGVVRSLEEAFKRYLGDHAPCFVKKATLTVSEAGQRIRQAGGVAVLAHPHRLVEDAWIRELVAEGIQGIEVFHPDHSARVSRHYLEIAEKLKLLVTGGSDCHGLRKTQGPLIGSVQVPYEYLERLKEAFQT